MNESVFKQAKGVQQLDTFAKMLFCFDVIVQSAILIGIHNDKYQGTMRESGDLRRDNGIIPVQLEIKKMTIMGQSPTSKSRYNNPMPSFNMSLSELFIDINNKSAAIAALKEVLTNGKMHNVIGRGRTLIR